MDLDRIENPITPY